MRRVADFIVRNWPLKVGAILLATVLYSGLVLGQNVRTWTGTLPVDVIRPPAGAAILSDPDPVTLVRYRAPLDVGVVSPESFRATVDLSRVEVQPGGQPQTVPVTVVALDQRIQIVDYQPHEVTVRLDPVATKQMPVTVTLGTVPEGLSVGVPQVEPSEVTIRGASSRIDQVTGVVARVAIDASALNVDRDIELVAIDSNGNTVPNIEIDPERARVRVAVGQELANRTLPVVPDVVGQPATGYRISSVTVEPSVVTVSGEATAVTQLETATTEPIDIDGRTEDLEAMVQVVLPEGVSVAGDDTVRVMITIEEDTGTRTFVVAVNPQGGDPGKVYALSAQQVNVVLGGSIVALDALNASELAVTADVSGVLVEGDVTLTLEPPPGLEIVSVSPETVHVQIVEPGSSSAP